MLIPVYKGKRSKKVVVAYAHVSPQDFDLVSQYTWHLKVKNGLNYVYCPALKQYLHVFLLGTREGLVIDHRDHDPLNNERDNLRFVTRSQNAMNKPALGVHFATREQKWIADIKVNGKKVYLGRADTMEEALEIRKKGELQYFGEYRYQGGAK